MEPIKLTPKKRQRLSSLLGLALDGSRLDGVVLRRADGSLQVQQSFSSLSLNPLTADAELVGREIRNHLDAAGVRERNCIVGASLSNGLLPPRSKRPNSKRLTWPTSSNSKPSAGSPAT